MSPPTEFSPLDERREGLLREAVLSSGISGPEEEEDGAVRSFLVFLSGSEWCAADLAHIRRVLRPASIARVSGAAPEVLGLMNYQGEVLCVLDLQRVLGGAASGETPDERTRSSSWCCITGERRRVSSSTPWRTSGNSLRRRSFPCWNPSTRRGPGCSRGRWRAAGRFAGLLSPSMCLNP